LALLYQLVIYLRNKMYDFGWFSSKKFKTPIICVGNLSVGGTGKTPMIEFLIGRLQDKHKLAVLSRGYGRKSKGFRLADATANAELLGDEPFQIFTKFPKSTVVVDADRRNGIGVLEEKHQPDLILLDDGFQHRKVSPHLSILLTTYKQRYVKDTYLPTGNLRDGKNQAKRADFIVVTKCPEMLSETEQITIRAELQPLPHQKVLFSYLAYARTIGGQVALTLDDLKKEKITLVTGIANPDPLVAYLEHQGLNFEHLAFKDHHFFSDQEIALFNSKSFVLTTEKDFVRLKGKVEKMGAIGIEHRFIGDTSKILINAISALT